MAKKVIIEWDYNYLLSLFFSVLKVGCYSPIDRYVCLGASYRAKDWIDCRDLSNTNDMQDPPSPCNVHRISPTEIIIDIGECYETIPYSLALTWHCTFLDIDSVFVQEVFGYINFDSNPLYSRDCIKYIVNNADITINQAAFTVPGGCSNWIPCEPCCVCDCDCQCGIT